MKKNYLIICLLLTIGCAQAQRHYDGEDETSFLSEHFFSYSVAFLAGCLLTMIVMMLLKKPKHRDHYRNPQSFSRSSQHHGQNDFAQYRNPVSRPIEPEIPSPKSDEQIAVPVDDVSRTVEFPNIENVLNKEPVTEASIMYFPNPNIEGNFRKVDGRTGFVEGASIYKFNLLSATEAEFEFCKEKSSIAIALNNRNELILNVAEELNAYTSKASQILSESDEKGTAYLDGSVWKVTRKAKIRYV